VNVHHLDNLVWVWNVNAPEWAGAVADYYPGAQYADVVTMDIYGEFKQEYYTEMLALAGEKPIALAEVGALPSPEVLEQQPRWAYFMVWSEWIQMANTPEQANAVYHASRVLTRDDPRLAGPMAAIRKATAERDGGAPEADPVTPGATAEAKALLARLLAAPGQAVLSGQENDASAPSAATAAVAAATGKQPAIYAAEFGDSTGDRQSVMKEALKAHASRAVVSLSWHPARPTDGAPASAHGLLTDYEWNDLLTPGSDLNQRWFAQVDEAAETLRELQKEGVAVLWNPLTEANGKDFWWAGRKGVRGSAELYRQLFDRLVNHDGVKNLVWVWETDPPGSRPDEPGTPGDYFPGLLYADAVEVRLGWLDSHFPARILSQGTVGKPAGVELTGSLPGPDVFADRSVWSWFLADAPKDPDARADAWRTLVGDPHVAALAAAQ
jgi:mannan endo-1,4-beta-mannosidase